MHGVIQKVGAVDQHSRLREDSLSFSKQRPLFREIIAARRRERRPQRCYISTLAPDLMFLDIQMPDLNGFDALRRLPTRKMPLVVFLTAYDQYAFEAFEAQALDYFPNRLTTRFLCGRSNAPA